LPQARHAGGTSDILASLQRMVGGPQDKPAEPKKPQKDDVLQISDGDLLDDV